MRVRVSPYDPAWPEAFERLRQTLWPAVSHFAIGVEHVGSTAVPGLAAKPVLDIDIVIPDAPSLPHAISSLASLGYIHHGDQGIPGREVFKRAEVPRTHHLYVCPQDSIPLRNHLVLRDHLRANPEARDAYSQLKLDLARQHPNDIDSYIRGKTVFILETLCRNGFDSDTLDVIRRSQ